MGKPTVTASAAACLAATVLAAVGQTQPAAPVRQERGNLILESIPPRDTQLAGRLARYRQSRQATLATRWLDAGVNAVR
jgi:hypothetical protein